MKRLLLVLLTLALTVGVATTAFAGGAMKKPEINPKTGFYCTHPDQHHPALYNLSTTYNTAYDQILDCFCTGRFGVGEIKLALQASLAVNGAYTADQILQMKVDLGGWGKVWQFLGLSGNWRNGDNPHKP